jgi:prephenate dehydrogenase
VTDRTASDVTLRVHVAGAGLIGTSVGLALRGRADVVLTDVDEHHLATAVGRGAGRAWDGSTTADVFVACVPPQLVPGVISAAMDSRLAAVFTHVASSQSRVQLQVESQVPDASAVCGGHPLAGRERSGPGAASARLFHDRPWVVCPGTSTSVRARDAVRRLAAECGAVVIEATPHDHDAAVALVSHLPQLAASAVAAQLLNGAATALDPLQVAGPGVQDTTRIAASDPRLWVDVLRSNAAHVVPLVRALSDDLRDAADALEALADADAGRRHADAEQVEAATERLEGLLARGVAGRARLPLKRAGARDVHVVLVSVPDRPGQLAGVLAAAAAAGVNVEDVRVEHLPGRPRGLVELLVAEAEVRRAREALASSGWDVVDAS